MGGGLLNITDDPESLKGACLKRYEEPESPNRGRGGGEVPNVTHSGHS